MGTWFWSSKVPGKTMGYYGRSNGKYLGKGWGRKTMENHESWTNTLGLKPSRFVWFTVSFVKMVIQWANVRTLWTPNAFSACSSWASTSSPSPSPHLHPHPHPPDSSGLPAFTTCLAQGIHENHVAPDTSLPHPLQQRQGEEPWCNCSHGAWVNVKRWWELLRTTSIHLLFEDVTVNTYIYIISTNKLMDYWCHFNVTQYQ